MIMFAVQCCSVELCDMQENPSGSRVSTSALAPVVFYIFVNAFVPFDDFRQERQWRNNDFNCCSLKLLTDVLVAC